MTPEARFWTRAVLPKITQACRDLGLRHHFNRVENLVGDGDPDVNYVINGFPGRIENKYAGHHPVRPTTQVLGRGNGMRRSQVIWAFRHMRAGGVVFCLIGTPKTAWLIDLAGRSPQEMTELDLLPAPRLGEIAAWCADHDSWGTLPLALMRAPLLGCR